MSREIDEVKYEVAQATRILSSLGLASGVTASLGHVSMRVPNQPDRFVVKGRGYEIDALEEMQYYDMIVCDLEGYKVDGPAKSTQCSEVKIHACILRERPDVMSVVHVHPRYTVLMTVLEERLRPMAQEGAQLVLDELPVYPHTKTVWSEEEGSELASCLGDRKAVLMRGHGASMTGRSVSDSVLSMLQLEEQAKMNWYAYCAAGPDHASISREQAMDFGANMRTLGDQPHLKPEVAPTSRKPSGVWRHYSKLVSAPDYPPA